MEQWVDGSTTWLFNPDGAPAFNKKLFDPHWLTTHGYLTGSPEGGRGNTFFFTLDGAQLVLREYLRGGLIRHVNRRHYLWTGLRRTRAYQEMEILNTCATMQLPTPVAYASQIKRLGPVYTASLITYRLEGDTFIETIQRDQATVDVWSAVGKTIAQLHNKRIWHADLNAHNILVSGTGEVSLIDFDRAQQYQQDHLPAQDNIDRLHRSLQKEAKKLNHSFDNRGWRALLHAYETSRGNNKFT
jgi:3-deoxy-D-manno-octulosonic acid kinase